MHAAIRRAARPQALPPCTFVCRAWRESWAQKPSVGCDARSRKPMARVSVARRNLREVGGETRTRRTGIGYDAYRVDVTRYRTGMPNGHPDTCAGRSGRARRTRPRRNRSYGGRGRGPRGSVPTRLRYASGEPPNRACTRQPLHMFCANDGHSFTARRLDLHEADSPSQSASASGNGTIWVIVGR